MVDQGFDVTLDGTQYRVLRGEGGPGYRKRWVRQQLQVQVLGSEFQSAPDEVGMLQTDWSGGARWEKPLLKAPLDTVYEVGSNFNTYERPGFAVPENYHNAAIDTNLLGSTPLVQYNKKLLAIGSTTNVSGSNKDIYQWTAASDTFVQQAYHSGYTGTDVWAACADPRNNKVAFIADNANDTMTLYHFDPVTPTSGSGAALVTGLTGRPGSNIFVHNDRLLVWDANKLYEITDPYGTPALSAAVANDGQGPDLLGAMDTASGTQVAYQFGLRTAIPTPDGIFYVKNVLSEGQPTPWVYRIDRDESGNDISTPVTTLPAGNMALSLGFIAGALIVSTTPDWAALLENDLSTEGHVRVNFYHHTDFNGTNGLGRPLGPGPDESAWAIMGAEGDELFIGGHRRIWVYDAAGGGIHPKLWIGAISPNGPFRQMAHALNSSGEPVRVFYGASRRVVVQKAEQFDDPDTVTNFGDDLTNYLLDSTYFDFGLPGESKTLSSVLVESEALDTNQTYTVQVSVDDGAWTTVQTHTNASVTETDLTASSLTGRRFRYRVIYQTKDTTRAALRAVIFKALTGEMVPVWDLILDGSELRSVQNQPQDPEAVYDSLELSAQKTTPVTLVDNYRSERANDTSTHTVKIASLSIEKESRSEAMISVSLMGAGTEDGGAT